MLIADRRPLDGGHGFRFDERAGVFREILGVGVGLILGEDGAILALVLVVELGRLCSRGWLFGLS
jgi:hypothetical protein